MKKKESLFKFLYCYLWLPDRQQGRVSAGSVGNNATRCFRLRRYSRVLSTRQRVAII